MAKKLSKKDILMGLREEIDKIGKYESENIASIHNLVTARLLYVVETALELNQSASEIIKEAESNAEILIDEIELAKIKK